MAITYDYTRFSKEMNGIIEYSLGFLEGIERGKKIFLNNLGKSTIELMKEFVDSNARVNPEALHHVYEWQQTGSPSARLFDIDYIVFGSGLSINSSFRQSTSIKPGSYSAFYDKARIMENGIPVIIKPKESKALVFNNNGETVFTSKEVRVNEPGGKQVLGSFESALDSFMNLYFTQAFLRSSGLLKYLSDTSLYKKNISAGARLGKTRGIDVGYRWIAKAAILEEA